MRTREARYLGIEYTPLDCKKRPPPGSFAAMHVQYVQRFLGSNQCSAWLKGRTPVAVVNDHVNIYWIPPDDETR
jgi:hypothetical protein